MNQQTLSICILILIFISTVSLISVFALMSKINKLEVKILQLTHRIHILGDDTEEDSLDIKEKLETLQTSVTNTLEEMTVRSKAKIYPLPQLSEMITQTIAEQIHLHTRLNNNRRIVPKEEFNKIIEDVCKTYPGVAEEFIVKKTISIIESMNESE